MRFLISLFFASSLFALAAPPAATTTATTHLGGVEATKWLSERADGAAFVSRNGHMYGMDSDAFVVFKKDAQVEVTEFGIAPQTYKGTFVVDVSGAIRVTLKDYPSKWPDVYLYIDGKGALLHPTDKDPSFRMGGRGGAVETREMAPYWPFRYKRK